MEITDASGAHSRTWDIFDFKAIEEATSSAHRLFFRTTARDISNGHKYTFVISYLVSWK